MPNNDPLANIELILGNSNKRFSGVTSTMLQVLHQQQAMIPLAVLGDHFLPPHIKSISFFTLLQHCRSPLSNGRVRVFHARRNNEMIQALILKRVFQAKIKIVFHIYGTTSSHTLYTLAHESNGRHHLNL